MPLINDKGCLRGGIDNIGMIGALAIELSDFYIEILELFGGDTTDHFRQQKRAVRTGIGNHNHTGGLFPKNHFTCNGARNHS